MQSDLGGSLVDGGGRVVTYLPTIVNVRYI